ncbi:MAG: signal peptidase I [Patescibacteria group bacterium]
MDPLQPVPSGTSSVGADASLKKKIGLFILELIQVVLISLAIIIPIRYFLVQPFYVKGASMEPNFYDHEYLIIDELSYRFHEPKRGDIVVFRYPRDPAQIFIKRVIGLPGETVEIADGKIKLYNADHPNGIPLEETYLDQVFTSSAQAVTLKAGEYYLMGDNRAASLDSRIFGAVDRQFIVGRVWLRGFPFDRWKLFNETVYTF